MGGTAMTVKEIQKRNEKSQALKVLRANGNFFVESSEGMVLYKVTPDGNGKFSCTCGDYAKGQKRFPLSMQTYPRCFKFRPQRRSGGWAVSREEETQA